MYEQPYNPYHNNVAVIKEYFKSPAVLALGIMQIVSIILTIVNGIVSADYISEVKGVIANYIDKSFVSNNLKNDVGNEMMKSIRDSLSASDSYSVVSSIPVFAILAAIGVLLLYFMSRDPKPETTPSAGVTILNILAIFSVIGAVCAVIGMVALSVVLFVIFAIFKNKPSRAFTVKLGSEKIRINAEFLLAVAIVVTVIVVITSIIILAYAISRKRYIGSIKSSLTSVDLSRKGAKAFGVFTVILAVFSGFGLLSNLVSLFSGEMLASSLEKLDVKISANATAPAITSLLVSLASFAVTVLQAKIALGYAKHIDSYKSGYRNPAASETYAPAGVGIGSSNTQQNPYSYLAQPTTQAPAETAENVNPYLSPDEPITPPAAADPVCPNCGAKTDGKAPFCGQCGSKLP